MRVLAGEDGTCPSCGNSGVETEAGMAGATGTGRAPAGPSTPGFRDRGMILSALLVLGMAGGGIAVGAACMGVLGLVPPRVLAGAPTSTRLLALGCTILNLVLLIGIWRWRFWALYGYFMLHLVVYTAAVSSRRIEFAAYSPLLALIITAMALRNTEMFFMAWIGARKRT